MVQETENSDSPTTNQPAIVFLVLLAAAATTVNWPFQYVDVAQKPHGQLTTLLDFTPSTVNQLPVMGGWPLRYLITYPSIHEGVVHRWFSPLALLGNVCLTLTAMGMAWAYFLYRQHRVRTNPTGTGGIGLIDWLVAVSVLSAPLVWWQYQTAARHADYQLQRQITAQGGAAWIDGRVPAFLANRLPSPLLTRTQRLRQVRIDNPSHELVSQLVDHHHLTMLRLGGDGYDLRLLDRLASNPHISDLRIAGRVLDMRAIQAITAHRHLDTLHLMRTNVSAEALQTLDVLPELQRLNLMSSDVRLADLGVPPWSATIRELVVPHPRPGVSDALHVDGWPKLQTLKINELDTPMNSSAMTVNLRNLPALSRLELDIFQNFDLTLENLPLLSRPTLRSFQWPLRLPRNGIRPVRLCCSRFVADRMPRLQGIAVNGTRLVDFQIKDSPQCRTVRIGADGYSERGSELRQEIPPAVLASLLRGIGSSDGPYQVDLSNVPLGEVDLSPLAGNHHLKVLVLRNCGIKMEQLKGIEPMKWLTALDLQGCEIDQQGVQWVLDSFPQLVTLAFSPECERKRLMGGRTSLEIVDRQHLQTIELGDSGLFFCDQVRIVNSPQLTLPLNLESVGNLEIRGAPSLTGIAIHTPPPPHAKVADFRDLHYLAVGGPTVTDPWIDALRNCAKLETLTLAYANVTPEALKRLANLDQLSSLALPGTPLDDAVVAHWPKLTQLHSLDVSETRLTGIGLRRLTTSGYLNHLALNHTNVLPNDLDFLKNRSTIRTLLLSGVGMDASTLELVLKSNAIEQLDLSDSPVTAEVLDAIAKDGAALRHLALRNCQLDHDRLAQIVQQYPALLLDLSGSNAAKHLLSQLTSEHRLVSSSQWNRTHHQYPLLHRPDGVSFVSSAGPAIIDLVSFANFANANASGRVLVVEPTENSDAINELASGFRMMKGDQ